MAGRQPVKTVNDDVENNKKISYRVLFRISSLAGHYLN